MRISDWSSDVCSSDLLREVAVVADVDAEPAVGGVEHRPAGVAGLEEELLLEAGDLRDVGLAVLAEVAAVGVDDRAGVVVDAGDVLLVDRHHDDHRVLLRVVLHEADGGAVGDLLGSGIPLGVLARTEVRLRSEEHTSELQSLMRISYA